MTSNYYMHTWYFFKIFYHFLYYINKLKWTWLIIKRYHKMQKYNEMNVLFVTTNFLLFLRAYLLKKNLKFYCPPSTILQIQSLRIWVKQKSHNEVEYMDWKILWNLRCMFFTRLLSFHWYYITQISQPLIQVTL